MKTILVPTDYSVTAGNALCYAMELAVLRKAKVVLFHAYRVQLPSGDIPAFPVSAAEMERANVARIKKIERDIVKQFSGKVKVESIVRAGFVSQEILSVIAEKRIDMIVMGITGSGRSKLNRAVIGSNTISIIKNTKTPVLVIPENCTFKKVEKIVFACDYQRIIRKNVLDNLEKIVKLLKTKLVVLDVREAETAKEKMSAEITLENALVETEINYSLYCPKGQDVVSEINSFIDKHKADWLTMAPQNYKFFEGLFNSSNTKQMVFHTHIPLLSIHN